LLRTSSINTGQHAIYIGRIISATLRGPTIFRSGGGKRRRKKRRKKEGEKRLASLSTPTPSTALGRGQHKAKEKKVKVNRARSLTPAAGRVSTGAILFTIPDLGEDLFWRGASLQRRSRAASEYDYFPCVRFFFFAAPSILAKLISFSMYGRSTGTPPQSDILLYESSTSLVIPWVNPSDSPKPSFDDEI